MAFTIGHTFPGVDLYSTYRSSTASYNGRHRMCCR